MLDELHVSNVALIEEASIVFSPGLTVLTGETGAGKTALLSALRLVSGQRADSKTVRSEADSAVAEARFLNGEEELVVRRKLSSTGRSRCSVNGQMASVSELAQASAGLQIHGQHDQILLTQPAAQLAFLDSLCPSAPGLLEAYRSARSAYQDALDTCRALEEAAAAKDAQLDYAQFVISQIEEVNPQEGEYEQLEADMPRMRHAESLATAAQVSLEALYSDGGALDLMASASQALSKQAGVDPQLDELSFRLDSTQDILADLVRDLRAYRDCVQFDPYALEEALTRMDALSGLSKRYGPGMEQVFQTLASARETVALSTSAPERLEAARAEAARCRLALERAAQELSAARSAAAQQACADLASSVSELAMPNASFQFSFKELPMERWTDAGSAQVELMYRPAPTAAFGPLGRIASGGELSRVLLAMECLRTSEAQDLTIVFDEVDSGIGGATGEAVARRLAQLSRSVQVVVVTHLPQVAAFADAHYTVSRSHNADGSSETTVCQVEGEERVAEIARMLAGKVDATALDHARSLIAAARGEA